MSTTFGVSTETKDVSNDGVKNGGGSSEMNKITRAFNDDEDDGNGGYFTNTENNIYDGDRNEGKVGNDGGVNTPTMSKDTVIKNVVVLSIAFLLLFTSFSSLQNLQSSLHKEEGLGTVSLSVIYTFSMLSGLFLPPLLISHFGCKWTMAVSIVLYLAFMAANFHALWGTMIPASILIGTGSSPLWVSKCTYLTAIGNTYAKLTNTSKDGVLSVFFGIFFMTFQSTATTLDTYPSLLVGQVWGNLLSSLVFKPEETNVTLATANHRCGASYCPNDYLNNTNLEKPSITKIYILCGVYIAIALLAIAVVIIFLDNIRITVTSSGDTGKLLTAIARHFYRSRYVKLLIPLTIYSGIEQAFISGEFTRSFISCSLGVWNVGFVMIAYGVSDSSSCLIIGRLVKYTGFIPWFILGFIVHGGSLVTMLLWKPSSDAVFIFYLLAILWGVGDAIMQTLINAYYGFLFSDEPESAFASYRLCESFGFVMAFGYSSFLCTYVKIWICLVFLSIGTALYGVTEILYRQTKVERGKNFD